MSFPCEDEVPGPRFQSMLKIVYLDEAGKPQCGVWQSTSEPGVQLGRSERGVRATRAYFASLGMEMLSLQLVLEESVPVGLGSLLGQATPGGRGSDVVQLRRRGDPSP